MSRLRPLPNLECAICIEQFEADGHHKPMFIPCCGQTICSACVAKMQLDEPQRMCPLCARLVDWNSTKLNRALSDLCSSLKQQDSHLDQHSCDVCLAKDEMESVAEYHCFECRHWLCEYHKRERKHQERGHSDIHSTKDVLSNPALKVRVGPRFTINKCSVHKVDNLLLSWCSDCSKPVCLSCKSGEHSSHTTISFEAAWTVQCAEADKLMKDSKSNADRCSFIIKELQERMDMLAEDELVFAETMVQLENRVLTNVKVHTSALSLECKRVIAAVQAPLEQQSTTTASKLSELQDSILMLEQKKLEHDLPGLFAMVQRCCVCVHDLPYMYNDRFPLHLSARLSEITTDQVSFFLNQANDVFDGMFAFIRTKLLRFAQSVADEEPIWVNVEDIDIEYFDDWGDQYSQSHQADERFESDNEPSSVFGCFLSNDDVVEDEIVVETAHLPKLVSQFRRACQPRMIEKTACDLLDLLLWSTQDWSSVHWTTWIELIWLLKQHMLPAVSSNLFVVVCRIFVQLLSIWRPNVGDAAYTIFNMECQDIQDRCIIAKTSSDRSVGQCATQVIWSLCSNPQSAEEIIGSLNKRKSQAHSLSFRNRPLTQLKSIVLHLSMFPCLENLDLSYSFLTGETCSLLGENLKCIPHLRCLTLSNCQIDDSALCQLCPVIAQLGRLKRLDLSGNKIGESGFINLSKVLSEMSNQVVLCFTGNLVTAHVDLAICSRFDCVPDDEPGVYVFNLGDAALRSNSRCVKLCGDGAHCDNQAEPDVAFSPTSIAIDASSCRHSNGPWQIALSLHKNTLTSLVISNITLSFQTLQRLENVLGEMACLTSFNLQRVQFTTLKDRKQAAKATSPLLLLIESLPETIQMLHLDYVEFTGDWASFYAHLLKLPLLMDLSISHMDLVNGDLKLLEGFLTENHVLRRLDVSNNGLTSSQFKRVAEKFRQAAARCPRRFVAIHK